MNLEKNFIRFVYEYPDTEMIKRKKLHSLRVAAIAEDIGGTDKHFITGLLHDVGRFPQAEKFQTFNDDLSLDHGNLGYEIVQNWGVDDPEILLSIKYHNKLSVPDIPEKQFCSVIRDADILDIMDLKARGELPLFKDDAKSDIVSEDAKRLIENRQLFPNSIRRLGSINRYLGMLAYVFELKNPKSFELLKEKKLLDRVCILHSEIPETEEYLQNLYMYLYKYCDSIASHQ